MILSTCSCLRNRIAASDFPTRYRAAHSSGTMLNSRGSLILWAKSFAVCAKSTLSWAKEESLMHADLYRVAFSFFKIGLFLPPNTNLSCSFLSWCTHCLGVRVASRFFDDEACVFQVRFNVQKLSSLISLPTLNTNVNNRRWFAIEAWNPSVPMSFDVHFDLSSESM